MRTLVIDNIDSFVYNLVQYVGINGGNPVVLENTASEQDVDEVISSGVDRIIISPGPKAPKDAGISNYVVEKYGKKIPLLGVCLGHQCIGYVFGATIQHAKTLMHGKTSEIKHVSPKIFSGLPNPFNATRYHSLVIDKESMPSALEILATSLDDGEVMAVKHITYPIFGVQFHPESIETKDGMKIIKNFMEGLL
ncbi:MAG: aminodeoxychorismate/anthranilate synthase component II [Candidatus Altiarchaeota archaeon]|nr:aminodeoxychorismate/anthranilate synthase component II [Candidatus Altiarchaeota archaeon]